MALLQNQTCTFRSSSNRLLTLCFALKIESILEICQVFIPGKNKQQAMNKNFKGISLLVNLEHNMNLILEVIIQDHNNKNCGSIMRLYEKNK